MNVSSCYQVLSYYICIKVKYLCSKSFSYCGKLKFFCFLSKKMDSHIYWLPTLYAPDNNGRIRIFKAGYSYGKFHSETGLLYKANGDLGKLMQRERKIKPTARCPNHVEVAKEYCRHEWEEKQRLGRFRTCDTNPSLEDAKKWLLEDNRKWPAVCKSSNDCKESELECNKNMPWYGQGKINGDRGIAWLISEEVKIYTRKCVERKFADKIRSDCLIVFDQIKKLYPDIGDVGIDGEIYDHTAEYHQQSRSKISRTVNKHENDDDLVFEIFDIVEYNLPFSERQLMLKNLKEHLPNLSNIKFIDTVILSSIDDIEAFFKMCGNNGYDEGIVLRRPWLMYSKKKEHKHCDMVKMKHVEDQEFKVIGYKEGNGDRAGCVIWELLSEGGTFTCAQIGSVEYQRNLFKNAEDYIGELLTVEFLGKSIKGKPLFPRGIRFRSIDDLPN
jgi:hypothetical protein